MSKSLIQRSYDFLRGKKQRGAGVDLKERPLHYGSRYLYTESEAQSVLRRFVESPAPCLIPRPGLTEQRVLYEFLNSIDKPVPVFSKRWRRNISELSGFFTPTDEKLTRFCCEMLEMLRDVDVYGAFGMISGERILCERYLAPGAVVCLGGAAVPIGEENPWTEGLRGQKVLIIHPFAETIEKQYKKRELLFANPKMLPEFRLSTIKTVQTLANTPVDFPDWFAALDHMKGQIDRADFDVALISGGAYAFHLARHCKMIGKKGIQTAGTGQLLFGIKGRRWIKHNIITGCVNEHWVFPAEDERPPNAEKVEGACYW